ncbi:MAG: acylneuraminate cytidylyltransferase family protein [Lachnospiraceae bacterium]|nr:acylneuraminate cytidylyltransferase family protein [Lachnospiraceae bacterium]
MIKHNISAVIPVKGSSSRLENKNILPFADSNLLVHKIRQLKKVDYLSEIIVSSDSDIMLEMAETEGVRAVKRPKKYADESQPFGVFLEYICDIIKGEHLMWACCTSPIVDTDLYKKAIDTYEDALTKGFDSLITVLPYQHFLLDEHGPMNFSRGLKHVNSQDLPRYYNFTNGIILSEKKNVQVWKYHFGPNVYKLEVSQPEAIDIDTYWDYVIAKAFYDELSKSRNI